MDKRLYTKMCRAGHMKMELVATRTKKPCMSRMYGWVKMRLVSRKGWVHYLNLQHPYLYFVPQCSGKINLGAKGHNISSRKPLAVFSLELPWLGAPGAQVNLQYVYFVHIPGCQTSLQFLVELGSIFRIIILLFSLVTWCWIWSVWGIQTFCNFIPFWVLTTIVRWWCSFCWFKRHVTHLLFYSW